MLRRNHARQGQAHMSYAEFPHGDVTLCRPSRFIREVPSDLVEEVRLKTTVNRAHAPHGAKPHWAGPSLRLKNGNPDFTRPARDSWQVR